MTQPVPGLRIHRTAAHLPDTDLYPWRISHHSGAALAETTSEEAAVAGALAIADMADWTAPADTLRDMPIPRMWEVNGVLARHKCWSISHAPAEGAAA